MKWYYDCKYSWLYKPFWFFMAFVVLVNVHFATVAFAMNEVLRTTVAQVQNSNTNKLLHRSVFNLSYYRNRYPKLRRLNNAQLKRHWLNHGIQEGRQGHRKFWWVEYRLMYRGLRNAFGTNGKKYILHYVNHGRAEGRSPLCALDPSVFDATYLALHNENLIGLSNDQIEAYWLTQGMMAGEQAHRFFCSRDYGRMYPDVVNAFGNDPGKFIRHYVLRTIYGPENRVGVPEIHPLVFDSNYYRRMYSDAASLTDDQIKMLWIRDLQQSIDRSGSALFNPKDYQVLNPESPANRRQAVRQYVFQGLLANATHRVFNPDFFDLGYYQSRYQDLSDLNWIKGKAHWLNHGMREGRRASEDFFIRNYIKDTNPWLGRIFHENYALAWDYYINFGKDNPYSLLPLPNPEQFDITSKTIFHVNDYGADPTGQTDSTPAVVAALNDIKQYNDAHPGETVVLFFDEGTYLFTSVLTEGTHPDNPYNKQGYVFRLWQFSNLIISGVADSTKLINANAHTGFFFISKCESVFFRDLMFDYQKVPYLQGTINGVSVVNGIVTITLTPEDSFLRVSDSELNDDIEKGFAVAYDRRRKGVRKKNTIDHYRISSITKVGSAYELNVSTDYASLAVQELRAGDDFVFFKRDPRHAVCFRDSNTLGLHHVEVNASPCVNFSFAGNRGTIVVDQCIVRPSIDRPASIVSSNGGGAIAQSNRDPIIIQNCYFQGLADDASNLYAVGSFVTNIDGNSIDFDVPLRSDIGDVVEFVDPQTGAVLGRGAVESDVAYIETPQGMIYRYTLSNVPAGIVSGPVPNQHQPYANTIAHNISVCSAGSQFVNNIVGPIRGIGIRIESPYSEIKDNIFMEVDVIAILIKNLFLHYNEGPIPHDITIQNNRFKGPRSGTIIFAGNEPLLPGIQDRVENIEIVDNTFLSYNTEAVKLSRVAKSLIQGNTFESNGEDERYDWSDDPDERSVVELKNCGSNVDILDNDFSDNRRYTANDVSVL